MNKSNEIIGFKFNSGRTEASMVWKKLEWMTRQIHLNSNKQVFDMELYVITVALDLVVMSKKTGGQTSKTVDILSTKVNVDRFSGSNSKNAVHGTRKRIVAG